MNNDFDPYDALIELNERMLRVERAHNRLAKDYERTQKDLTETLKALQTTQQHVLKLHQIIHSYTANRPDTNK